MFKSVLKRFATEDAAPPADDEPYVYKSAGTVETVLVLAIGVEPGALSEIIEKTRAKLGKKHRLVYVTDDSDFSAFRKQAVAFEYLPSLAQQRLHAADMPWQSYSRERWNLLLAKWKPKLVLSYGMNIEAFLEAAPANTKPEPIS